MAVAPGASVFALARWSRCLFFQRQGGSAPLPSPTIAPAPARPQTPQSLHAALAASAIVLEGGAE